MIYTFLEPRLFLPTLPSPEQIRKEIPNPCGWTTPLEDCAISLGMYMHALINAWEKSKEQEFKEKAQKIFSAFLKLGRASKKRGFIPRGLHPEGAYYPNSSVDQYTMYVFGLWAYHESKIATAQERKSIKEIMQAILERLHEDQFYIKREDGKDGIYGDLPSMNDACRATRLLQIILAGAHITGEHKWLRIYEKKKREAHSARLSTIERGVQSPSAFYPIMQNAYALYQLLDLEEEKEARRVYLQALKKAGEQAMDFLYLYKSYDEKHLSDGFDMHWERALKESEGERDYVRRWWSARPALAHIAKYAREPLEAAIVLLLSGVGLLQLKEVLQDLFFKLNFERFFFSHVIVPAECVWHLCCNEGLM
jgi:hypothetical protein